jgi:hypothetical protein
MFDHEEAQVIFRTGFFKNVHPLGCCKKCHSESEIAVSQQTVERWDDGTEASIVHLPAGEQELFDDKVKKPAAVYPMAVSC